jgi:ech hydrogenase subunit A
MFGAVNGKLIVTLLAILILAPLVIGLGLLGIRSDRLRRVVVLGGAAGMAICSLNLVFRFFPAEITLFDVDTHLVSKIMLGIELLLGVYIVYVGIRNRHPLIVLFMLAQGALITWFELTHGLHLHVEHDLFVDKFSIIMALINGLVGSSIFIYALGYMGEFHEEHHPEIKDRRPLFFGLLAIFQGAMNGVVFSNNLLWLFFFWEITTLCSFLLIGYKQNEESKENSLRALCYNLSGGVVFAIGIVWYYFNSGNIELLKLVKTAPATALLPAALLSFAGITKSAQFPFSRWLLGAMVAPTPVSALLHSSTMVKAGVYLIIRMSPILRGSVEGILVAMVGAVTFLLASFAAVNARDAKRVLAYSTVANLGLIVLCAGIGTYEAVWAAILLIIFHAVAKCLLFLCVGVIEHKLHSRDIEKMSGLILSMPRISILVQIGIAGMFLAPFGMLISKYAVLKAVVDIYPLLTVFIAFGSAATLCFWVKWLGKLIEVIRPIPNVEKGIRPGEWFALYFLAVATTGACLFFPMISSRLIEPYVMDVYGQTATLSHGNFIIMIIMLVMICLFPLSFFNYGRRVKVMDAYLGGGNMGSSILFKDAAGKEQSVELTNYYFGDMLNEKRLFRVGVLMGMSLLLLLLGFSLI